MHKKHHALWATAMNTGTIAYAVFGSTNFVVLTSVNCSNMLPLTAFHLIHTRSINIKHSWGALHWPIMIWGWSTCKHFQVDCDVGVGNLLQVHKHMVYKSDFFFCAHHFRFLGVYAYLVWILSNVLWIRPQNCSLLNVVDADPDPEVVNVTI